MAGVYMAQRRLAAFFELTKDTWLSDHFYHRCLETGKMVRVAIFEIPQFVHFQ